ncbi:hypothetical protein GCK32_008591 [Trichostrongylus colubriformis]|uniref:UBC core domain-containing protein n=1 Tax=Trichostrongylus colubriformis TaxID=6319 RepID=A0AAN8FK08_TRICO
MYPLYGGEPFPKPSGQPNPSAIRRLQRDFEHLTREPIDGIVAVPDDANILIWHYVIKGSADTPYEGGYYYGKILFQPDFPWKPPAICMLTPNGRFHTNTRLCLSISDYHPETWNPGWTVSAILVGLHSFMNEETPAAGCVNEPFPIRRKYAAESRAWNLACADFTKVFPFVMSDQDNVTASDSSASSSCSDSNLSQPAHPRRAQKRPADTCIKMMTRIKRKSVHVMLSSLSKSAILVSYCDVMNTVMVVASVTATARLKKDYARLLKEPVPYVRAAPLHENILEWHYIIYGAPNTPYDGGVYHGKLVFPSDFPFKPPSIYMITPSGRFQVNTRLCLSISDFHPDTWNPAWTVSTIITEKKILARRSKAFNLKDRLFCELFPDVAEEIRKSLSEANTAEEATLREEEERLRSAAEPSSGLSSLVSNLISKIHITSSSIKSFVSSLSCRRTVLVMPLKYPRSIVVCVHGN